MQGYEALLLPAIKRIDDPLERASVATEVAGYLGLDRNLVLNEFRKIPSQRRPPTNSKSAVEEKAIPVRERMLLRSLIQEPEIRPLLLPRLAGFAVVRSFVTWPVLDEICALMEENPDFAYAALEERLDEERKALMSGALFADHSSELLSSSQAEVFITQVESEEREAKFRDLQRKIQMAERSGNLQEAMALMQQADELKRQNRQVSG